MHHALEIQEIVSNIFDHFSDDNTAAPSLAALAITCRTFKEPALDVLWRTLDDLSALARCLPKTSRRLKCRGYIYTIHRPLTQSEWDILRSYTRRIQSILYFGDGHALDKKSIKILSNPPSPGPLFPNLHTMYCTYSKRTMPLLHLPLPSLVYLVVDFKNPDLFLDSSKSFPNFSPHIRDIFISVLGTRGASFYKIEPDYFCRWRNLCDVGCHQVALDRDALVHLSRIPTLTRLECALSTTFPASDSFLSLSNLLHMTLKSDFLDPVSRLLSQTRLPAIKNFFAFVGNRPSRQELTSFLAGLQTSGTGNTIEELLLLQSCDSSSNSLRSEAPLLGLKDLWPCLEFSNLRHLRLNIEWNVDLADSDVLELAALPQLDSFRINDDWGWNSRGGITPGGLVRLLQTCPSLRRLNLVLDTRGYTELPSTQTLANLGLTLTPSFCIDVLDSIIEAESVPAIATLLSGIAACTGYFFFRAWSGRGMAEHPNMKEYRELWGDVEGRVDDSLGCPESSDSDSDAEVTSLE
ncbi:hypothetical protein OG21DRAFT_1500086 [Imleria badia]|nr:hypothetical protein OG21DRAFT_1500086 [Imleria badia]